MIGQAQIAEDQNPEEEIVADQTAEDQMAEAQIVVMTIAPAAVPVLDVALDVVQIRLSHNRKAPQTRPDLWFAARQSVSDR
jgi:hypothetical protein